jgi:hypothetical protein
MVRFVAPIYMPWHRSYSDSTWNATSVLLLCHLSVDQVYVVDEPKGCL